MMNGIPKTSAINFQNEKLKLEKKLQQLRENLKREKEQRRQFAHTYTSKWRSSQIKTTHKDTPVQRSAKPIAEESKIHLKVLGCGKPQMFCKKFSSKKIPSNSGQNEASCSSSNPTPLKTEPPPDTSRKLTKKPSLMNLMKDKETNVPVVSKSTGDLRQSSSSSEETLLAGQFNEEESSKSFQEAVEEWRSSQSKETRLKADGGWVDVADQNIQTIVAVTDEMCQTKNEERDLSAQQPITVEFSDHGTLVFSERLLLQCYREEGEESIFSRVPVSLPLEQAEDNDADVSVDDVVLDKVFHGLMEFDSYRDMASEAGQRKVQSLTADEQQVAVRLDSEPQPLKIEFLDEENEDSLMEEIHEAVVQMPDSVEEKNSPRTPAVISGEDSEATYFISTILRKSTVEVLPLFTASVEATSHPSTVIAQKDGLVEMVA